uniref:Zinc finger, CCHC-type n=1 Tax=Tanacetum cinerariifolium TaxID=118510 RepID=A0A6L2K6J7_TANCI|nr:zinc finger, CCHC-type [Tanacetum cinerariifolium]
MSRTMLNEQSLPQKFWCNSIDTSIYILNRILIRAILGKTLYELLRGRKPTLDNFRVFGSKCFILNTKDYLTKFDPESYECIFLGYSQNSKAYIILSKHTRKIKESLNVTFDETPPPSKTSTLVDDDLDEEEAIKHYDWLFKRVMQSTGKIMGLEDNQGLKARIRSQEEHLGEAEVILGIRIKQGNNDLTVKFQHNKGTQVSQLEYSRDIRCLMYAMISTRPDIAFDVGKLSRYTSNPSALHWQALDHSSTSGWVFLLGGGVIFWASKKQTCITSSTMKSEFVALAAAGNEAEWLRNLVYEILLWPKPIYTISIRCDSAATFAKAYSQV